MLTATPAVSSALAGRSAFQGCSCRSHRYTGLDEIKASARERLARRVALEADLVLLVIDSDLTRDLKALETLQLGKLQLNLNRCVDGATSNCRS